MRKHVPIILILLFCVLGYSQERFLQYSSKDTINGKPRVKGDLGVNLKLNGYYDFFGGLQDWDTFNVGAINVFGSDDSGSLKIDMYQTQIKFESSFMTKKGNEFKAMIEFDFWGGNGKMRLRKAYVTTDHWLIGQNWVVFGDEDLWPNIMEFEGPPSGVWVRQPQLTYFNTFRNKAWEYKLSLSAPIVDYHRLGELEPLLNEANQTTPDFMAALKYHRQWGHIRFSSILRNLNYIYANEDSNFIGYGFTLSGIYKWERDNFQFQFNGGKGILAYSTSVQGFGYDGYPTVNNEVRATPSFGGWASYELYYSPKFHSNFVIGYTQYLLNDMNRVVITDGLGGSDVLVNGNIRNYHYYGIINLMYNPNNRMIIGGELDYGYKKIVYDGTLDGVYVDKNQGRDAMRFSFGIMYSF